MSIELCVLASGSAGNCTVVRAPGGIFLIDCGIGPRTAQRRMDGTGVDLDLVRAICLTHLDRDHFNLNWIPTILRRKMRVFCAARRVDELLSLAGELTASVFPFDDEIFSPVQGVNASSISVAHDQEGSHAFLLDGFGMRVGYATDLGHVPESLLERFCGTDVLAIESNYDAKMQVESARPWFLKRRIMGGRGHLSNEQALKAVKELFDRCRKHGHSLPRHVVLLHRSLQCNCPNLIREMFARDRRIAPRLVLAEQFQRTDWLGGLPNQHAGQQLSWAWA